MKKSLLYLATFVIGIVLVVMGIFTLKEDISGKDSSGIWTRSLVLFFWMVFTTINFILYRRELRKSKDR